MSAAQPPESHPAESRPPVVLQVLPSLVTGGVERGTVEITQAIAQADGVALVASAGGRMVATSPCRSTPATRSPSGATPRGWRR